MILQTVFMLRYTSYNESNIYIGIEKGLSANISPLFSKSELTELT